MRRLIAIAAVVLMASVLLATPALAATPGAITIHVAPPTVADKGGTVTVKLTYSCTQYAAPYNVSDNIAVTVASIANIDNYYGPTIVSVTCDGRTRKLVVALSGPGFTGRAAMVAAHAGWAADGSGFGGDAVRVNVKVR